MRRLLVCLLFSLAVSVSAQQQSTPPAAPRPNGYAGPSVHIPGLFITPVPNAPFSGTVSIVSHEKLPDGTEHIVTTKNHVARASSGVIYNERRLLVPAGFQGDPRLLSFRIYDPSSRMETDGDPYTHIARQSVLPRPSATVPGPIAPGTAMPGVTETDLGTQQLNGMEVHGLRRERTLTADRSGTGKAIVITDDLWYSAQLSIYLLVRHDDPRSGEQIVALSELDRHEPDSTRFRVPDDYKIVDETPPQITHKP